MAFHCMCGNKEAECDYPNCITGEREEQKSKPHMTSVDKVATVKAIKAAAVSDGSTASYYELPAGAAQLQDLISHRNMNAQLGEIFRACYRYGLASHSDQLRDAKKIKFYIEAEIARLEKLGGA